MASDLLSIARSGAQAARRSLDVAASNIANADTEGYVRRSALLEEAAVAGGIGSAGAASLSGVRVAGVLRNADAFRSAEVRRTGSDLARAEAQLAAGEDIESALEGADVFGRINGFTASLQQLQADPASAPLRAATMQAADAMAQSFAAASQGFAATGARLAGEAAGGARDVNALAAELARLNGSLARASAGRGDTAPLVDRRDLLLQRLARQSDASVTIAPDETVTVQLGGSAGPLLVSGASAATLGVTTAPDGTISFDVGGASVALAGGALAGVAQGLVTLRDSRNALDAVANAVIGTVNAGQANGSDLAGTPGQPMFSGSGAASIAVAFTKGALIAAAPAGSPAGSRSGANLAALGSALAGADPAGAIDTLLTDVSGGVAGARLARDTLSTVADDALSAFQQRAAVDLDKEAVDLVRFQQAFQASGRVMQVASTLFDTLLGIG